MQVSLIVMLAVYNFGYNNFKSCNALNVLSVSCVIYLFIFYFWCKFFDGDFCGCFLFIAHRFSLKTSYYQSSAV